MRERKGRDARIEPQAIRLEASSVCQLRCPSCPTTSRAIDPAVGSGLLDFDDFVGLLDANPGLKRIELSNYGEILLNPALPDILRVAHDRGIAITADNGVNLNRAPADVLEALVRHRVRRIGCSIDGASEETYRRYRVNGSFEAVIANIRTINEWKRILGSRFPRLTWNFIAFGHNEHEIPAARRLARELGMRFHVKLSWDENFSPLESGAVVRQHAGAVSRSEFRRRHGRGYVDPICRQLWEQPQVNWDGRILGCGRNFWGEFGGNAFRDGLAASLNSEGMNYARAMLEGREPPRDDVPCSSCDIYLDRRASGRWMTPVRPGLRARAAAAIAGSARMLSGLFSR
jgi:MoaA/NifB/PqqE/SkfB family radical SAM enzyme